MRMVATQVVFQAELKGYGPLGGVDRILFRRSSKVVLMDDGVRCSVANTPTSATKNIEQFDVLRRGCRGVSVPYHDSTASITSDEL